MGTQEAGQTKWANEELERRLIEAPINQRQAWSAFRDRTLTVAASAIAISVLVVGTESEFNSLFLLRAAWVVMLVSLFFGFISLYFDHRLADRTLDHIQTLGKLKAGWITDETLASADSIATWAEGRSRIFAQITNYSLYASAMAFFVGIGLITAFAWVNAG